MTSDHIIATVTVDTIATLDTTAAFVIPLVVVLASSPVMWHEEHIWNFNVLQRVLLSNLVACSLCKKNTLLAHPHLSV
jgi:hypothetical protein